MRFIFIYFFIFIFSEVLSQNIFSGKFILITSHPAADKNLELHKNKIDKKGIFTFEPGLLLSYELGIYKKTYLGISTSLSKDRFSKISGYSEIYLKYTVFKYWKHFFRIGFGPAVHYGEKRDLLENYTNEEKYKTTGDFQYKISWLSGFFEYNYYLSKKTQLSFAFNHVYPYSLGFLAGANFMLSSGKGCDCPSYK